jgi:polyphosphate kinase 2 (PPK2 family)
LSSGRSDCPGDVGLYVTRKYKLTGDELREMAKDEERTTKLSRKDYEGTLAKHSVEMVTLQEWVKCEGTEIRLVGVHGAGKDSGQWG